MKLSSFDYALPENLIAQHPLPLRDQSRMMVVRRRERSWEHRSFADLPGILEPRHLLVMNNTRVFPARLWARRIGREERIELLLLSEKSPGEWSVLARPARKAAPGDRLDVSGLRAEVTGAAEDGSRTIVFEPRADLMGEIERVGRIPLPPYIRRPAGLDLPEDRVRYQTVFAQHTGSVAAPTAGLHFTPEVFRRLDAAKVGRCEILLHVGYGTFKPVRCEEIAAHRMDAEYFEVGARAGAQIRECKVRGGALVAVGTTTTRVLEHLGRQGWTGEPCSGYADLFIYPGFPFTMLDGLLTNFHLPRSTLLMLVCAFAGREFMLECYGEAVRQGYRFFSYGDCMLIL